MNGSHNKFENLDKHFEFDNPGENSIDSDKETSKQNKTLPFKEDLTENQITARSIQNANEEYFQQENDEKQMLSYDSSSDENFKRDNFISETDYYQSQQDRLDKADNLDTYPIPITNSNLKERLSDAICFTIEEEAPEVDSPNIQQGVLMMPICHSLAQELTYSTKKNTKEKYNPSTINSNLVKNLSKVTLEYDEENEQMQRTNSFKQVSNFAENFSMFNNQIDSSGEYVTQENNNEGSGDTPAPPSAFYMKNENNTIFPTPGRIYSNKSICQVKPQANFEISKNESFLVESKQNQPNSKITFRIYKQYNYENKSGTRIKINNNGKSLQQYSQKPLDSKEKKKSCISIQICEKDIYNMAVLENKIKNSIQNSSNESDPKINIDCQPMIKIATDLIKDSLLSKSSNSKFESSKFF